MKFWFRKKWGVRLRTTSIILATRCNNDFYSYWSAASYVEGIQKFWIDRGLPPGDFRIIDLKTREEVTPKMIEEGYKFGGGNTSK